ncbi:DUF6660 family protein [Constantimarinum furrinae]|uniref:DUF6660 family protein n=1 Tax=Constantimarinum furrinae TaxID=2562285 RepID=UPI00293B943E|nr:DUF6660 family protein [Constantimarinum furrinae]
MKFTAFILSIYIFTLNLAPCEDNTVLDNEVKTEISQSTGDNHNHQNSDLCSPFCICQCCHINATYLQFTDLKLDIDQFSTNDFLFFNNTVKGFTGSILQPPRA